MQSIAIKPLLESLQATLDSCLLALSDGTHADGIMQVQELWDMLQAHDIPLPAASTQAPGGSSPPAGGSMQSGDQGHNHDVSDMGADDVEIPTTYPLLNKQAKDFPTLTEGSSNYNRWIDKMHAQLIICNCEHLFKHFTKLKQHAIALTSNQQAAAAAIQEPPTLHKNLTSADATLAAIIAARVDARNFTGRAVIKDAQTHSGVQLMLALWKANRPLTAATKVALMDKFARFRHRDQDSVEETLARFSELRMELQDIGEIISESQAVAKILAAFFGVKQLAGVVDNEFTQDSLTYLQVKTKLEAAARRHRIFEKGDLKQQNKTRNPRPRDNNGTPASQPTTNVFAKTKSWGRSQQSVKREREDPPVKQQEQQWKTAQRSYAGGTAAASKCGFCGIPGHSASTLVDVGEKGAQSHRTPGRPRR